MQGHHYNRGPQRPPTPCSKGHADHIDQFGHPACSGHKSEKRGGDCCRHAPMAWQSICGMHGGRSPANLTAAKRRQQRAEAEQLMVTLGEPINDGRDYSEVIADRVAIRRGHVAWLLSRVQLLEPDALAWGLTKRKTAVAGTGDEDAAAEQRRYAGNDEGDTLEAKPSIWYAMYTDAARDLEKLCIEAVRVGIEARRLQMDERTADQLVRALDGIVTALGHDPNAPETAAVIARHLELVA